MIVQLSQHLNIMHNKWKKEKLFSTLNIYFGCKQVLSYTKQRKSLGYNYSGLLHQETEEIIFPMQK